MSSRGPRQWLLHIVEAVDHIEAFTQGISFEQYKSNELLKSGVKLKILTASEAAIRLGDAGPQLLPTHDWAGLRGIGNYIRHAYDGIDDAILWNSAQTELPVLRALIRDLLASGKV